MYGTARVTFTQVLYSRC